MASVSPVYYHCQTWGQVTDRHHAVLKLRRSSPDKWVPHMSRESNYSKEGEIPRRMMDGTNDMGAVNARDGEIKS